MNQHIQAQTEARSPQVELRTGTPYANLIAHQQLFAAAIGSYFDVAPADCIPTAGTTGAIEAIRNHVFRLQLQPRPTVLTVCPDYWRARESFTAFGFQMIDLHTEPHGFEIDEAALVAKAKETPPHLLYLSLPNNPTGAIFDPATIIAGTPETTAIILDLTLPSRALDARSLTRALYQKFNGRRNLFLVGSTSKSHGTAEYRIGWAICAASADAAQLRQENRNVVASVSIKEAIKQLAKSPSVIERIENSFALLHDGAERAGFVVVTPARRAQTGYVLIRAQADAATLRRIFARHGISVMWGSEFGLCDEYIRLETLEPHNIKLFLEMMASPPPEECLLDRADEPRVKER